jgi:sRNA-binding carbon storage regulator CsrA
MGLVRTTRRGDRFVIGDVEFEVIGIRGKQCRLRIEAPREIQIEVIEGNRNERNENGKRHKGNVSRSRESH